LKETDGELRIGLFIGISFQIVDC